MRCLVCESAIASISELLKCVKCKGHFHYKCLNMTTAHYMGHEHELKTTWECHSCVILTKRRGDEKQFLHQSKGTDIDHNMSYEEQDASASVDGQLSQSSQDIAPVIAPLECGPHQFPTLQQIAELLDTKLESKLDSKLDIKLSKVTENFKQEMGVLADCARISMKPLNV